MSELTELTIAGALAGLGKGDFTSRELTAAHIAEVEKGRALNAFTTETPEQALAMADAADAARRSGNAGPLNGIPLAIKDLFCTKGVLTTASSHILSGFKPPYESTVTSNLWRDGAVMLGKVSLDEFAMGSSNETSFYGPVENPWRTKDGKSRVPGGSSGGSAAAVAARMAMGATGTDTGGSIRQPASFCGLAGIKPTYGRCSRWGIIAFASSLDQAGPITRTVEDSAIMLGSMAGHDPRDSTSINTPVPDYRKALTGDIRGMQIGIPKEYRIDGAPQDILDLWDKGIQWMKDAGAQIVDISLPHTKYALATYYVVAPAEASSNLARYDGVRYGLREQGSSLIDMYENTRGSGFGHEVQRRILIGTYVLSAGYYDAYYLKAQKVRTLIAQDFEQAFGRVDAILTPTAPCSAFSPGEKSADPISMYLNDVFTVPASLAGIPGMSVAAGICSAGMPLGLQILGRPFEEETVLKVSHVIEQAAGFTGRPGAWWKEAA
jgi:aspartyl-tRNA(Asn)/glutamyl-tRNA(Gln) amidotransferase subunit A